MSWKVKIQGKTYYVVQNQLFFEVRYSETVQTNSIGNIGNSNEKVKSVSADDTNLYVVTDVKKYSFPHYLGTAEKKRIKRRKRKLQQMMINCHGYLG